MGEYAQKGERRIKIGTCEELFYVTRADIEALIAAGWHGDGGNHDLSTYLNQRAFRCCLPDHETPGNPDTIDSRSPDYPNRVRILLSRDLMEPLKAVDHGCIYPDIKGVRVKLPCPFGKDRGHIAPYLLGEPMFGIDLVGEGLGVRRAVFACPICDAKFNALEQPWHVDIVRAFDEQYKGSATSIMFSDLVRAGLSADQLAYVK